MVKRWKGWDCHDCGAKEGELHERGCDMEGCPFCGRQLLSCCCCYEKLGIDVSEGTWAYSHGLTDVQSEQWLEMLEDKGRIPYILIPNFCGLCGQQWPEEFDVPDEEWRKYVIPELQEEALCLECYEELKVIFPNGWKSANPRLVEAKQ